MLATQFGSVKVEVNEQAAVFPHGVHILSSYRLGYGAHERLVFSESALMLCPQLPVPPIHGPS